MIKRICFFSIGFAFNRLVRLKFYEKIFPKDVEMFLFTTNKYEGKEKEKYQQKYAFKRIKVFCADYSLFKLPLTLRKFCKENKIDRVINVGNFFGGGPILIATLFKKTDYELNILADILNRYKIAKNLLISLGSILKLVFLYPLVFFSKRTILNDYLNYKRAPLFFLTAKDKIKYLPPVVDTKFFKPKNKTLVRKKLNLPLNKKIIIFVGRVNYLKCADILKKVIKANPGIYFIVIGRLLDKDFFEIKNKYKNFELIEKKSSKELVEYYNAADLGFCLNRGGAGMGTVNSESLACGTPIIVSKLFRLKKSKALYQTTLEFEEVNEVISTFFNISPEERKKLSRIAREYAKKNYSSDIWKNRYLEYYLD